VLFLRCFSRVLRRSGESVSDSLVFFLRGSGKFHFYLVYLRVVG
jgi:hypothetical protein